MADSGVLLLEGGAEFEGRMAEVDRQAIAMAAKEELTLLILPTAAAPDHNHVRAGNRAVQWFRSLGVENAVSLSIIDKPSADDASNAEKIEAADFIFMLGGFPGYLFDTLEDSRCWAAICDAFGRGATLAGSSAGAMILCDWFFDPQSSQIRRGFGVLEDTILIPHHDQVGDRWLSVIARQMPDVQIIGIDEQTGMLRQRGGKKWRVCGKGAVHVYDNNRVKQHVSGGSPFNLSAGRKSTS